MSYNIKNSQDFFSTLLLIDQKLATEVKDAGCLICGSNLHCGNYERNPRGLPDHLSKLKEFNTRLSFCCGQIGCRKRHMPPSVIFLGRRVYLSFVVVLAAALAQGLTQKRENQLFELSSIPHQTLRRWIGWWQFEFPTSTLCTQLKNYFIGVKVFPIEPLDRMTADGLDQKLLLFLKIISPIGSSFAGCMGGDTYAHKKIAS